MALVNRDTASPEDFRFAIERERGGPAYTALEEDLILVCGGVMIPWPTIGVAWMALTDSASKHRIWLTRTTRRFLEDVTRCYGLHRLEAIVRADNGRNARWIETLGFSRENGCARAYTPDRVDGIRYERVQDAPGATISFQPIPKVGV